MSQSDFYRLNQIAANVQSQVSQDIQETSVEGLDAVIAAWNLPNEVSEFLSFLKFSE